MATFKIQKYSRGNDTFVVEIKTGEDVPRGKDRGGFCSPFAAQDVEAWDQQRASLSKQAKEVQTPVLEWTAQTHETNGDFVKATLNVRQLVDGLRPSVYCLYVTNEGHGRDNTDALRNALRRGMNYSFANSPSPADFMLPDGACVAPLPVAKYQGGFMAFLDLRGLPAGMLRAGINPLVAYIAKNYGNNMGNAEVTACASLFGPLPAAEALPLPVFDAHAGAFQWSKAQQRQQMAYMQQQMAYMQPQQQMAYVQPQQMAYVQVPVTPLPQQQPLQNSEDEERTDEQEGEGTCAASQDASCFDNPLAYSGTEEDTEEAADEAAHGSGSD